MLTRILSRLRRIDPSARRAPKAAPRRLTLETLEAREVPAIIFALNSTNSLLRFDSATPGNVTTIPVTGLATNDTLQGIDFRPRTGQLYGSAVTGGSTAPQIVRTYTINTATGAATLVGATAALPGAADTGTGYDFNPTVDRIRYVNEGNENARLNPNNGALAGDDTNLTFTAPATGPVIAAAYDRNTDRQSAATIPTTLYLIDRGTAGAASLVVQGGINGATGPNGGAVTGIGALGITLNAANDGGFDILEDSGAPSSLNNNGLGIAYAALTTATGATPTGLYTINLTTGAATLVGPIGPGTAEIFSIAAVPNNTVVVGSGAGALGDVRIVDTTTGVVQRAITNPFTGFTGGTRVAAGDVTGDGVPDVIVTAIAPNGHVKVFNGVTGTEVASFFSFAGFQGTVNVGAGDINGDGITDILVSADGVLNGHVKAIDGTKLGQVQANGAIADTALLASFFAYPGFLGNLTVSGADFDNNGTDEIVTAATNNGHVKVFGVAFTMGVTTGQATAFIGPAPDLSSFLAFQGFTTGPVNVASGDVTGDGFADIVVSSGTGTRGNIKVFNGQTGNVASSFLALPAGSTSGVAVALADANSDGLLDIRATPGAGAPAQVFTFNLDGTTLLAPLTTFANFQGGSTVAGARF